MVDLVLWVFFGCGLWFDLAMVCGFFSFFLTVVGGDLVQLLVAVMVGGCGGWGMGGWMRWPAVLRIIGLRNRETKEGERGKIKNNKEIIFK